VCVLDWLLSESRGNCIYLNLNLKSRRNGARIDLSLEKKLMVVWDVYSCFCTVQCCFITAYCYSVFIFLIYYFTESSSDVSTL
jgi:hypothetical protein